MRAAALALLMTVMMSACTNGGTAEDLTQSYSLDEAGLESWAKSGWREESRDPERLEAFLYHTIALLRHTTPGLSDADRSFVPQPVKLDTPCKLSFEPGGETSDEIVGNPWEAGRSPESTTLRVMPVRYCYNHQPRTILYSLDGMRQAMQRQEGAYQPTDIILSFAQYVADPNGRGVASTTPTALGCAEGRVVYGLLKASMITEPYELYLPGWSVAGERRTVLEKVVATGQC